MSATLNAGKSQRAPVEVDEVDHVAVHHAVDDVAERAAEHERQPDREQRLIGADAPQPEHEHDADDQRQADEEPALPAGRLREDAERGAGVLQIDDVEERQQRDRVLHLHGADDQRLGRLVEQHDEERQPQPVAGAVRRREPDLRKRIGAHAVISRCSVAARPARRRSSHSGRTAPDARRCCRRPHACASSARTSSLRSDARRSTRSRSSPSSAGAASAGRLSAAVHARRGRDEHEAQLFTERLQTSAADAARNTRRPRHRAARRSRPHCAASRARA